MSLTTDTDAKFLLSLLRKQGKVEVVHGSAYGKAAERLKAEGKAKLTGYSLFGYPIYTKAG